MPQRFQDIHTYILNLPDRADRREHMLALMESLGVPQDKYEFVTPPDPSIACTAEAWLDGATSALTKGKCSRALVVKQVFDIARARGQDYFFVLEDDIVAASPRVKFNEMLAAFAAAGSDGKRPPVFHALFLQPCSDWCTSLPWGSGRTKRHTHRESHSHCLGGVLHSSTTSADVIKRITDTWHPGGPQAKSSAAAGLFAEADGIITYALPEPVYAQDSSYGTNLPHASRVARIVNQNMIPQHECEEAVVATGIFVASSLVALALCISAWRACIDTRVAIAGYGIRGDVESGSTNFGSGKQAPAECVPGRRRHGTVV